LVLKIWTGIIASGAILYYLSETQHNRVQHITSIQRIAEDAYVWMDPLPFATWLYHSYNQMRWPCLMWLIKRFRQWVEDTKTMAALPLRRL
jgi:DNA mismatch repair ATPase MutS